MSTHTEERKIPVTCWCEATVVNIPVQWLSEARTGSCGPKCGPGCPTQLTDSFDDLSEVARTGKKTKMVRFNTAAYDPRADSSFGYSNGGVRVAHPSALILEVVGSPEVRLCPCGCAEAPRTKTGVFMMGHDARLRGKLARALAGGSTVVLTDASHTVVEELKPTDYASRFSTAKLDWSQAVTDSAAKASTSSARADAEKAVLAKALGPQVGDTKLLRIGRWDKTGSVVAVYDESGTVVYEYVDGKGETHRVQQVGDGKLVEVA